MKYCEIRSGLGQADRPDWRLAGVVDLVAQLLEAQADPALDRPCRERELPGDLRVAQLAV